MNDAPRRHQVRFLVWMAIYSAVILADGFLLPHPAALDAVHVAGALGAMIPLAFAGFEIIARVRAMDELQRRIHLEGMLFGVVGTSVVILSVGLLQWIAALPAFSVGWLWVVLCAFYGLGTALAHRRYA
jgi:hypothetical protein